MQAANTIHAQMTVNEVVQANPETLPVFHAVGIDSCCGGALPVQQAAERHGLDLELLLRELQDAITDGRENVATSH